MPKNKGSRPLEQLVPLASAAKMLKVSVRSLQRLSKRGVIRAVYVDGGSGQHFRMHDISALSEATSKDVDLQTVANLAMQAYVLARGNDKRLDDLYYLLGFDRPILGTTEEEVIALYVRAQEALLEPRALPGEVIHEWAGILYTIDETYLDLVRQYTAHEEPWKVFHELAGHLVKTMPVDLFSVNPPLKSAYAYLAIARNNFRSVAYYYCRRQVGVTKADKVFRHVDDPLEEVCRLLFPSMHEVLGARG